MRGRHWILLNEAHKNKKEAGPTIIIDHYRTGAILINSFGYAPRAIIPENDY